MVEDRIYVSDPMPFRVIEVRKASTNRMSAETEEALRVDLLKMLKELSELLRKLESLLKEIK